MNINMDISMWILSNPEYLEKAVQKWSDFTQVKQREQFVSKIIEELKKPTKLELANIHTLATERKNLIYTLNHHAMHIFGMTLKKDPELVAKINQEVNGWLNRMNLLPSIAVFDQPPVNKSRVYLIIKPHRFANPDYIKLVHPRVYTLGDEFDILEYIQRDTLCPHAVFTCDQPLLLKPVSMNKLIHRHINFSFTKAVHRKVVGLSAIHPARVIQTMAVATPEVPLAVLTTDQSHSTQPN
jgi:hypothetical protein